MNKNKLGIAITSLLAASATVNAAGLPEGMTIYGKASVELMSNEEGTMKYAQGEGLQLETIATRLGVKGTTQLTENNLNLIYMYEWQVNGAEQDYGDTFSARNTYVGLQGGFGKFILGRNDTVFKSSEGKVDLFNDRAADIGAVLPGQSRVGDSAAYYSPKMGQLQFALTYTLEDDFYEGEEGDAGYAATLFIGDKKGKKQPYFVALSMVDSINNVDAFRVTAQYKLDDLKLGAIYQDSEQSEGSKDGTGYVVSAAYSIDKWVAKVQYADDDSGLGGEKDEVSQVTVGVDYNFNKAVHAFAYYTEVDREVKGDDSTLAIGMQYAF